MVRTKVALLILLYFVIQLSVQSSAQDKSMLQEYVSVFHKFSFSYPRDFKIKEYGPSSLNLSAPKGPIFDFDITDINEFYDDFIKFSNDKYISKDKMKEVAFNRTMAYNTADGPDGSYAGVNPVIEKDYKTLYGLRAIKFYLTGVFEDFEAKTTTKKRVGPFYGVDISSNGRSWVLVFMFQSEELANSTEEILMNKIVESIKLIR